MELKLVETKIKERENRKVDIYTVGNNYTVYVNTYEDGHLCVDIKEKRDEYVPLIYARSELFGELSGFEIQTTSYGSLSAEEIKKMVAALNEAVEVVEILTKEFVK